MQQYRRYGNRRRDRIARRWAVQGKWGSLLRRSGLWARRSQSPAGFTLLETLIVVTIAGIVTAIASTSWLSFLNTWRLTAGQDQVYQIMRLTQSKAKHEKRRWQASFRNVQNQVQWAMHPTMATVSELEWRTMPGGLQIDPNETTLYRSRDDVYRLQFNHQGHVNGRLGRLTLKGLNPHKTRRCVFASTLIGTLRKAKNQRRAENGRYCY